MSFFNELKRRNVIRVATAYIVAVWLIIQVVETLFPVFGLSDAAIRLVVIVLAVLFVPIVILAWVFQFTPEGLKLDTIGEPLPASQSTSRKLDRAIIVTLVLGISYFALDKFVFAPGRMAEREAFIAEQAAEETRKGFYGDRSIAVMPFTNLSSDPEQEYFVDGIAEEVLNLLARIRQLRVISRSSVFALRGKDLEAPEIAKILDVGHILEGSVRKAGNRVRVTAQLIEARSDAHLWSKTYERELDDVFLIQDEIAADVAKNLQIVLLEPLPRSRYVDPEVLALTEQARVVLQTRPQNTGKKMYDLLNRALEIDPDYVPALELMDSAEFFRGKEGAISPEEMQTRLVSIDRRIRELDPNNAWVDASEAWELANEGRLEEAAQRYLRALNNDMTNSEVVRLAGLFARNIGRMDVSERLLRHAVAIDPLCFQCLYHLSRTYWYEGKYDLAEQARNRYLSLGTGGKYHYGLMLLTQGKAQAALDYYTSLPESFAASAQGHAGMAMAWHALGDKERAQAELDQLLASDDWERATLIAQVAAWMGDKDMAFEWLVAAPTEYFGGTVFQPLFESLHDDPRWVAYRESIDRSEARLEAIEFDPVMPE